MRRFLTVTLVLLIFLLSAAFFGIDYAVKNVLPYSPIRPQRITPEDIARSFGGPLTPSTFGLEWSECDITVEDSIHLCGWFIKSKQQPAKGTVFFLHGIGSSKEFLLPMAVDVAMEGMNCVAYDSRAHGASGGLNCTFGYYEKRDLSAYLDSTIVRYPGSGPYGVFGASLGAAVAVQAMAVDKRISCGVVESPFADLRQIIHDYSARRYFLRADFLVDRALAHSEMIAHFRIDSVRPAFSAREVTQPVMVVHGLDDHRISPAYGKEVFDNLASREKEWYPIPHAGHDNVRRVGGKEYQQKILEFFQAHLKPAG